MARKTQGERTQFLELFEPILFDFFSQRLDKKEAEDFTVELIEQLSKDGGGMIFYIPKNLFLRMSNKKRQILSDYPRHKIPDIAKKHGVSIQYAYRVIKQFY